MPEPRRRLVAVRVLDGQIPRAGLPVTSTGRAIWPGAADEGPRMSIGMAIWPGGGRVAPPGHATVCRPGAVRAGQVPCGAAPSLRAASLRAAPSLRAARYGPRRYGPRRHGPRPRCGPRHRAASCSSENTCSIMTWGTTSPRPVEKASRRVEDRPPRSGLSASDRGWIRPAGGHVRWAPVVASRTTCCDTFDHYTTTCCVLALTADPHSGKVRGSLNRWWTHGTGPSGRPLAWLAAGPGDAGGRVTRRTVSQLRIASSRDRRGR
jgi:hypothetical protein